MHKYLTLLGRPLCVLQAGVICLFTFYLRSISHAGTSGRLAWLLYIRDFKSR
jgi:hypothetical protein